MIRLALIVLGAAWLCSACVGLRMVWSYDNTPGASAAPTTAWPGASRIPAPSGRPMVVMFAHPRCPCTRASIEQLASLVARCKDRLAAYVVFYRPEGSPADWNRTDSWRSAEAIPGVRVLSDEGGAEARRLHAVTSGQTMLYDGAGRLLFSGGITGSRGHSMTNAGSDAIEAWVLAGKADLDRTPVFGCSLLGSGPGDRWDTDK